MQRYRLRQGKLRETEGGEWVRAEEAEAEIEQLRNKLQRVRDWIVFAATSPGGIVTEIDDSLMGDCKVVETEGGDA